MNRSNHQPPRSLVPPASTPVLRDPRSHAADPLSEAHRAIAGASLHEIIRRTNVDVLGEIAETLAFTDVLQTVPFIARQRAERATQAPPPSWSAHAGGTEPMEERSFLMAQLALQSLVQARTAMANENAERERRNVQLEAKLAAYKRRLKFEQKGSRRALRQEIEEQNDILAAHHRLLRYLDPEAAQRASDLLGDNGSDGDGESYGEEEADGGVENAGLDAANTPTGSSSRRRARQRRARAADGGAEDGGAEADGDDEDDEDFAFERAAAAGTGTPHAAQTVRFEARGAAAMPEPAAAEEVEADAAAAIARARAMMASLSSAADAGDLNTSSAGEWRGEESTIHSASDDSRVIVDSIDDVTRSFARDGGAASAGDVFSEESSFHIGVELAEARRDGEVGGDGDAHARGGVVHTPAPLRRE
jgi:hypothetical protein